MAKKTISKQTLIRQGKALRYIRKKYKKGYSAEDVSRKIGMQPSYLANIELGFCDVRLEYAIKLFKFYGASLNEFAIAFDVIGDCDG